MESGRRPREAEAISELVATDEATDPAGVAVADLAFRSGREDVVGTAAEDEADHARRAGEIAGLVARGDVLKGEAQAAGKLEAVGELIGAIGKQIEGRSLAEVGVVL